MSVSSFLVSFSLSDVLGTGLMGCVLGIMGLVVVLGLGVVVTGMMGGHDCLQKPQLPCPPICSSSLSTFVEHQYLQIEKMSLQLKFCN